MIKAHFSDQEKMEAFDEIAAHYYNRNFGSMSKTDYETMLFRIFLNHLKQNGIPSDDYSISRTLGITQSKVRSLKMRNELLQSDLENDAWKEEFAACVGNAVYDETKKLVKVIVPEVTVMMELRHFMEENRWYDEYQLNPKLFQCPLVFYLPLCERIGGNDVFLSEDAKKKLKELSKKANEKEQSAIGRIVQGSLEDGFKDLVSVGTTAIIVKVLEQIPFVGVAATIVGKLIMVLRKNAKLAD